MIVLIPSFQPDERLEDLVDELAQDDALVVVDDGSGAPYRPIFERIAQSGTPVLSYSDNHGKGHALKTGLSYIADTFPGHDVVTADSDGQHRPSDIRRVAAAVAERGALVLGGRRFDGVVPARSRWGNAVSRLLFRITSGQRVHDTQTGLRGIPSALIPDLIAVDGDRFEWEMAVLMHLSRAGASIEEVAIDTVYLDDNASSHFRPVRDSLAVLRPLLKYSAVSFGSFVLDALLLMVLFAVSQVLWASVLGARLISAGANFLLNRQLVFRAQQALPWRTQLVRYAVLALAMIGASYVLIAAFTALGLPLIAAKVMADAAVYVAGFLVQRGFVFARSRSATTSGHENGL